MKTLIISYFLLLILYFVGVLISVVFYGNSFLENIVPNYSFGVYLVKGLFFVLPVMMIFIIFLGSKILNKMVFIKSFFVYLFFCLIYVLLNEVNVYIAKNPLGDMKFWLIFMSYTILSFFIVLLFSYPYLQAKKFIDIFFIFFSFFLIGILYSLTVKKYFIKNRVESEIIVGKKKIRGKIIATDRNFVYVVKEGQLRLVGKNFIDLLKISTNKR